MKFTRIVIVPNREGIPSYKSLTIKFLLVFPGLLLFAERKGIHLSGDGEHKDEDEKGVHFGEMKSRRPLVGPFIPARVGLGTATQVAAAS